jgi:cytochrome c biogenesis protein CcmG, thiol:disulfide interchange protein DsbE
MALSTLARVSARAFAIVMAAIALVALLGFGLASKGEGGVTVGEPPAEGELPFLDPTASGTASLADYGGEWVLANIWASWCDPCRAESPALQEFAERNRGRVTVIGIDTQDNTDDALEFIDEFGLTYEQLHDGSGAYADDLGTTGVPETVLIDPEGNVAFHYPGAVDEDILAGQIEPLIRGDA